MNSILINKQPYFLGGILILCLLLCQCTSKDEISGTSVSTGNPSEIAIVNDDGTPLIFSGKVQVFRQNHNPFQDEPYYEEALMEEDIFSLPPVNDSESGENELFNVTFTEDSLFGILKGVYYSEELQRLRTLGASEKVTLIEPFTLKLYPIQDSILDTVVRAYVEGTALKYEGPLPIEFKISIEEDLNIGFVNPNGILMYLLPLSAFTNQPQGDNQGSSPQTEINNTSPADSLSPWAYH